jgi:hypothetical protein
MFDQTGTTNNPIAPMLGSLQVHDGPTPTLSLLTASPAIDKGNSFGISSDQRGAPRPGNFPGVPDSGDGSDIGAFELIPPILSIARSADRAVISWSVFNSGYSLQSTTNLSPTDWITLGGTPAMIGNRFYLTNEITGQNKFFRLHAP